MEVTDLIIGQERVYKASGRLLSRRYQAESFILTTVSCGSCDFGSDDGLVAAAERNSINALTSLPCRTARWSWQGREPRVLL